MGSLSLLWSLSPRGACPYCSAVSQSNLFELDGAAGVPNLAFSDGMSPTRIDTERSMSAAPLASRMRPRTLEEYAGQRHLLAPGLLLRRAIDADRIQSLIFFGPPGTGKTTLAQIIAARSKSRFEKLNAVESNLAEMRRVLQGLITGCATRANPPCSSLTKSTDSTALNKMCCCPTWKAAR